MRLWLAAVPLLGLTAQESPQFYNERGSRAFKEGRIEDSIRDFDMAIKLEPRYAPEHWQRGISLYYVARFDDCRKQFEIHKTVNPEDVENAVWHYLCVARLKNPGEARKGLIPIQSDTRIPMMEVYAMFRGESTPEKVLETARRGNPAERELHVRLFYSHLYIGLYLEAQGDKSGALKHIGLAAEKYPVGHYMWDVARVHVERAKGK
ncbi:MAG: hypothetical protein FJW39_02760 [Acidobacteria bacterium]|nr:hypothetical protein [Acidobacteriota bacterium]